MGGIIVSMLDAPPGMARPVDQNDPRMERVAVLCYPR